MSSLTKFKFDRNTVREDGLVNITALAKSYCIGWLPETIGRAPSKDFTKDWLTTDEAQASIAYLASLGDFHYSDLVKVVRGGNAGGTWCHSDLAEIFAQWLSVEYRFAVVQLIRLAKEGDKSKSTAPKAIDPQWTTVREQGKIHHKSLANEIKDCSDDKYAYSTVTNTLYTHLFGMTAKEIRVDRKVPLSKPARDGLTKAELLVVALTEESVAANILPGFNLNQVIRVAINRAERIAAAIA